MRTKYLNKIPLCKCGCGGFVKWNKGWNKFIHGHNQKGKNYKLSEETKKKMKAAQMEKTLSKKTKLKIGKANKGRKHSEETKRKISKIRAGKKHSEKSKLKMSKAHLGKKCSEETKKKISKAFTGKNHPFYGKKHSTETILKMSGKNASNWKGGISCEPYCDVWLDKDFKDSIKERDNNECQNPDCLHNCDYLSLGIHHIDYIKKNCKPRNLITLCNSCNSKANKNRKQHTKFYQKIIEQKYKLKGIAHV